MNQEHLPHAVESVNKNGLAGATNATSSPNDTTYLTRGTALIPNTAQGANRQRAFAPMVPA